VHSNSVACPVRGKGRAGATFAVAAFSADPPADVRLVVIGASEEEAATSRGARRAMSRYRPEACLIGEPSGWDRLTLGYGGRLILSWSWEGGLGDLPGPTLSPAEVTVGAWRRIDDHASGFNQRRPDEFLWLRPSLVSIQTSRESAFGHVRMEVNLRHPPGLGPADVEQAIRSEIPNGELSFSEHEPAFQALNNTLTRALRSAIRAEGGQPRHVHKTGTSEMNVVGPLWHCPIAAYGPGDSRLDHTPEEHIDLDKFQRSVHVLGRMSSTVLEDRAPVDPPPPAR
jgi:LysW-gamma-L-lysine carboxypeptidase